MKNIANSLGGFSVVFIRYNPDLYTTNNIRHHQNDNFRLKVLKEWLDHYIEKKPECFLEVVKLFYNGFLRALSDLKEKSRLFIKSSHH